MFTRFPANPSLRSGALGSALQRIARVNVGARTLKFKHYALRRGESSTCQLFHRSSDEKSMEGEEGS